MNKKKVVKIVLIVVLILLAIFLGIIIRRMIIINDISNKVSKYKDNNNHYEKIVTDYSGESMTTSEYYCKGEKAAMFIETTTKQSNEKKKLTQYFTGDKSNSYIEAGTTKIAMLNSNGIPSKIQIWAIDYNNLWDLFYLSLITPIKSIDYNGKECYLLDSPELRHSYIEKDTGLILRAIDGKNEKNDKSIVVEYDYSFDNVDDSIFVEPDINEYKIQENN